MPRFNRVPANTATADDFAAAKRHQRAFAQYGRATYRLLAPRHNLTARHENMGTPELRETGRGLERLEREQIELRADRSQHAGEIRELAARAGVAIDPAKLSDPRTSAARLRRGAAALDAWRKQAAEETTAGESEPAA